MSNLPTDHLRVARRKLRAARSLLANGLPEEAAADAYFAMLRAARAGLAERGHSPKTHQGTWGQFARFFVKTGLVDKHHYDSAQRAMELRDAADYWGEGADATEAQVTIRNAEAFVRDVGKATGLVGEEADGDSGVR